MPTSPTTAMLDRTRPRLRLCTRRRRVASVSHVVCGLEHGILQLIAIYLICLSSSAFFTS